MAERFTNLVELYQKSCARHADNPLFGERTSDGWRWISYREFGDLVEGMRGGLAALGVGNGDRVAIVSNNRVPWAVIAHATYGRGAAIVPMYEAQHRDEWEFILRDSGAKVVVAANDAIHETLTSMQPRLPALEHVVGLERSDYAALTEHQPVPAMAPSSEDLAALIYTSGTTGKPKGVLLSHGNITSNINAVHQIFPLSPADRSLSFLPWAHAMGQVVELHTLLSMGCSLAINDDIKRIVENLAEVRPTVLVAVPRIFNRVYAGVQQQIAAKPAPVRALFRAAIARAARRSRGETLSLADRALLALADRLIFRAVRAKLGGRLAYVVSGSAALEREVAELIDALGLPVYEGYGLTETSPIVTANYPGHRRLGSAGKPLPGVSVEIDESRSDVAGEGEIVVRGPNVMKGYYQRPEETAAALTEDGALRTGDLGRLDGDGYLYITGRIKEQYKLENGKYVMPTPLEEQLKLSPHIANVMIYGDGRPYNVALVVPELEALRTWAEGEGVALDHLEHSEPVRRHLQAEIEAHSASFRSFERPKRFHLLREDFTTENGLLTPTLKVKRAKVEARYREVLDALYSEQDAAE